MGQGNKPAGQAAVLKPPNNRRLIGQMLGPAVIGDPGKNQIPEFRGRS